MSQVLPDLSTMGRDQLEALVSGMAAKLARAQDRKLTIKVSDKGACSVYGLGRFPVTLYASQWRKLLARATDIETFLADNAGTLSEKD